MMTSTAVTGPAVHVDIVRWPGFLMSRIEVTSALSYLAHKVKKTVRCMPFRGHVGYAAEQVNVYVTTAETCQNPVPMKQITLNGRDMELDDHQAAFRSVEVEGQEINDDKGHTLASVDHNALVIRVELTAVNNEAGRDLLAYIVEKAIPLFHFDVEEKLNESHARFVKTYGEFYASAVRSRMDSKDEEVKRLERDSESLYYQLVETERNLPLARKELEILEKQSDGKDTAVVEKQAAEIAALTANGLYEEITPAADGTLTARTAPIAIEYDGWTFELGRYEIKIAEEGKVNIASVDGTDAEGYPHPHVDGSGKPCLGNIAPEVAKVVGRMRVAEALTLLHDFLCSYNSEGPYVKIGKFDPEYEDPDEDPCEECSDHCTPYCVADCGHNGGNWGCSDCAEYRSKFCYEGCEYNQPNFSLISPCDDCEEPESLCFLECPYNRKWDLKNPCKACKESECRACPYAEKKRELGYRRQHVHAA